MKYNDILKSVTVRINLKDEETGSGIIYKHVDSNSLYIFTAKHCLYGSDFNNKAKPKDISIDKIRGNKKYTLQKGDKIIKDDVDDIVAIIIHGKNIPYFDEIPEIKLAEVDKDCKDVYFKGYPNLTLREKQLSARGNLNIMDSTGSNFHLEPQQAFLRYYKNSQVIGQCKGFSGSGICGKVGETPYLQGIISQFDKSIGFECIALGTFIKTKLQQLKLDNISVDSHLSDNHLRNILDKVLNELKPRYQKLNFKLPIENYFQQMDPDQEYRNDAVDKVTSLLKPLEDFSNKQTTNCGNFLRYYSSSSLALSQSGNKTFNEAYDELVGGTLKTSSSLNFFLNDFESSEKWNCAQMAVNELLSLFGEFLFALKIRSDIDSKQVSKKNESQAIRTFYKYISDLNKGLDLLSDFLNDKKFIGKKYMLLKGEAGYGKSQLLGFIANQRLNGKAPAILILGQSLTGEENIWSQIRNYCCESNMEESYFLEILNEKGRVAGRPVFIFIDAINEGKGIRLWNRDYENFISTLKSYPFIKVILSYRNSYEKGIFRGIDVDKTCVVEHNGFDGLENEAVEFFFQDANMSVPTIPYYSMQFRNPLFLRLFTLLYKSKRGKLDVNTWVGTMTVYNHFFEHINDDLAHPNKFAYDSYKIDLVNLAIKKFVKKQWKKQLLYLKYSSAFKLIEKEVTYYINKKGFFEALISHGLFYENRYLIGHDEDVLGVDFAYQKLGEYIKIQYLFRELSWEQLLLEVDSKGKLFFLKKKFESDNQYAGLIEAASIIIPFYFEKEIFDLFPDFIENENVVFAFISSFRDRSPLSITQTTLNYLLRILQLNPSATNKFWTDVLTYSFQPANALNTDFIHRYLLGLKLAERDATWTVFINNNYDDIDSNSIVAQVINWTLDYKKNNIADSLAIQAIGKTLFWFFGSTNRELRDYATKAAVFIFTNNILLLKSVMVDFEKVNDSYISQRIYAVALGAITRSQKTQENTEIANYIYQQVFIKGDILPDILLRDYARLALEYCRYLGLDIPEFDKINPPYNSLKLPKAPTDEEIENFADEINSNKEIYAGINYILQSMVTEHSTRDHMYGDFGRYTFGAAVSHWRDFPDNLLSNIAIQMIVKELGYNKILSEIDSKPNYSGRGMPKVERIGKKYQWIVFYQILARLADNYEFYERYHEDKKSKYSGPWNPFVRDFDPTTNLLKRENVPMSAWWQSYSYALSNKDLSSWMQDTQDLPDLKKIIEVKDDNDDMWLLLENHDSWRDGDRDFWYQLRSYIIPKKQKKEITRWLENQNFMGRWMPESQTITELYLREYFWSPSIKDFSQPYYRGEEWHSLQDSINGKKIGDVSTTSLEYLWERDIINQDENSTSLHLPNKKLFNLLKLRHGDVDGYFINESGKVIAFNPSSLYKTTSRLLIRKKELLDALETEGLDIFWTGLGEKFNMSRMNPDDGPYRHLEISNVAYYKKNKLTISTLIKNT